MAKVFMTNEEKVHLYTRRGLHKPAKAFLQFSAKFENGQYAEQKTVDFATMELMLGQYEMKMVHPRSLVEVDRWKYCWSKKYREEVKAELVEQINQLVAENCVGQVQFMKRKIKRTLVADNWETFKEKHPKKLKELTDGFLI